MSIKRSFRSSADPQTGLTRKQEAFARAVADGLNYSDSYRRAYQTCGMAPATVWCEASRLAQRPKVAARVAALMGLIEGLQLQDAGRRRAYVLRELRHLSLEAESARDRLRALELLGRSIGLFDGGRPQETLQRNSQEIRAELARRLTEHGLVLSGGVGTGQSTEADR